MCRGFQSVVLIHIPFCVTLWGSTGRAFSPLPDPSHIRKELSDLDELIRRLPFALDDGDAVGALFSRWRRRPSRRNAYLIDLWTYCYVRRYFLIRFVSSGSRMAGSDLEHAVEAAFGKIERSRSGLIDPERYPRWVIVICRNTFASHVRRTPGHVSVDMVAEPAQAPDPVLELHDQAIRAAALEAAIGRLPKSLRPVARMKLIDGLDYTVIQDRTGAPVPTIRSYLHKALVRLRQDPQFLRILGYGPGPSKSRGADEHA